MHRSIRKLNTFVLLLMSAVLIFVVNVSEAHAAETSGECGDALTWRLSGDRLIIEGSGPMWDFTDKSQVPWSDYREEISSVRFPDGMTTVGRQTFFGCSGLTAVALPDSVHTVGRYAFAQCDNISILDLGDGIKTISAGAFRECTSLVSVRLPDGLISIGEQAFDHCESLRSITIPTSVTELGMEAFSFCHGLVRADVRAEITELPEGTFYGCEQLTDVALPDMMTEVDDYAFRGCENLSQISHGGKTTDRNRINETVKQNLETSRKEELVVTEKLEKTTSGGNIFETEEGVRFELITTTETDNAVITTTTSATYTKEGEEKQAPRTQVDVTLENKQGWDEIKGELIQTVDENHEVLKSNIYLKNDATIDREMLSELGGKNVSLEFRTSNGSAWEVDCSQFEPAETETEATGNSGGTNKKNEGKKSGSIDLSCERTDATEEQTKLLGGATGYQIKFKNEAEVNAKVMIKLPAQHARQTAYLYQIGKGKLEFLQAVVVDGKGFASFYLGRVDSETVYLVGINVTAEEERGVDVIIPESLQNVYNATERVAPVEYVITGRTSSWGMNINQVTWILIGGMFVVVTVVGVTMFILNKRKLSMGYVPDLSDEDEE